MYGPDSSHVTVWLVCKTANLTFWKTWNRVDLDHCRILTLVRGVDLFSSLIRSWLILLEWVFCKLSIMVDFVGVVFRYSSSLILLQWVFHHVWFQVVGVVFWLNVWSIEAQKLVLHERHEHIHTVTVLVLWAVCNLGHDNPQARRIEW